MKKKKIAIDASRLTINDITGTQAYLLNLILNLSYIDKVNQYTIYFRDIENERIFSKISNQNPNFSFHHLEKKISWTQLSLAAELLKRRYNILLCPWQTMPVIHPMSTKVVSVIHGLEYKPSRFYTSLYTSHFSSKLIAVSNFTKSQLRKKFMVNSKKIAVVYEGVDVDHYYKRDSQEVSNTLKKYSINSDYILFVGYMVPRKNIKRMMHAFSMLIKWQAYPDNLTFVLAGEVPNEYKDAYKWSSEFGIERNVKFLGRVPQSDVPVLLSGAKMLAFASMSEGFGLPILEAMACETPVLSSNKGAIPEVAGDSALLVDPKNVKEIFGGMKTLLVNNDESKKYVRLGLQNIERFTWRSTAEGVLRVFNSLYANNNEQK